MLNIYTRAENIETDDNTATAKCDNDLAPELVWPSKQRKQEDENQVSDLK